MWHFLSQIFKNRTSEKSYFLKEIIFRSSTPGWSESYLQNPDFRLTTLLKARHGNAFWENYSKVLVDFHQRELLLLRTKSITDGAVMLTQVWRSAEDFEQYLQFALRGVSLKKSLEDLGMTVIEKQRKILATEIPLLIQELESRPHIMQFIINEWRKPGMKIGDPLKQGKRYLPFPEESLE